MSVNLSLTTIGRHHRIRDHRRVWDVLAPARRRPIRPGSMIISAGGPMISPGMYAMIGDQTVQIVAVQGHQVTFIVVDEAPVFASMQQEALPETPVDTEEFDDAPGDRSSRSGLKVARRFKLKRPRQLDYG